ncbi:hypothetical protein BT93_E2220 [Corymbia citriodora subsp. variegata]|nr:hypothetical protein BT93_E2220 [Corymbia citriodora subsp. variegata]KAF8029725.1 hypothetical protein BT93_E2220 [Corymbia citriodora subsp. variegata]
MAQSGPARPVVAAFLAAPGAFSAMKTDEGSRHVLPFQLQFDKPLASQVKMAEWNPEKDLLAMVTEDSKVVLHRFNWQRLWTISPR